MTRKTTPLLQLQLFINMAKLKYYNNDGQQPAARAVLALLQDSDGVKPSWNKELSKYDAEPQVGPWYNGREKGYVVYLPTLDRRIQLNIAFYEHRNSDSICAIAWICIGTMNPPVLNEPTLQRIWKDKYDISKSFGSSGHENMCKWINGLMESFWETPEYYKETFKDELVKFES